MEKIFKVLIVEDEEIEAKALSKFLFKLRNDIDDIKIASNGIEAINIVNNTKPDIIFMDINMPGMNGLDCINRINELNLNAKIIITSAYNEFEYAKEAMRLRVVDFLVKPVKSEDINRLFNEFKTQITKKANSEETVNKHLEDMFLLNLHDEDKKISKQILASALYGNYDETKVIFDDYYEYLKNEKESNSYQRLMWVYVNVCNGFPEYVLSEIKEDLEYATSILNRKKLYEFIKQTIKKACDVINNRNKTNSKTITNLMKQIVRTDYDQNLSLELIAKKMNYSVFYLTKSFKAETNTTFLEYLTAYRIEKAKELLNSEESIIKEISYKVGFNSQSYFSKIFKKYTNMSPMDWMNKTKEGKRKMNYKISNEIITLEVSKSGAEMQSIKSADGTEYLWQGDPKYWGQKAINLFPYCARLTDNSYYIDGKLYHMFIHGLAMYNDFEVVNHEDDAITFEFKYNSETLESYPRKFIFDITYKLENNRINITFDVYNKDEKVMYFGIGGHPGFNVPLNKELKFEDYYLDFKDKKELTKIKFTKDCYPDGTTKKIKLKDNKLYLKHNLFDDDAVVVKDTSQIVTIKSDKDDKAVTVCYPQMANLGIWHMPRTDAPYVCVEPWVTLPSRKGIIEEFETQPDLIKLEPNKKYTNNWYIQID